MADNDILAAILTTVNNLHTKLDRHMEEEEGEITQILDAVTSYREESDRRHTALVQSVQSYMNKQEDVYTRAFVVIDGKPDLEGHRDDHLTRKQFGDWAIQVKRDVTATAIKGAILAFLSWAGYILWVAFIQGPKQ